MGVEKQQTGTLGEVSVSREESRPCRGRGEFWRKRRRKMKRVCCCFALLLLFNLAVTLHLCHKTSEIYDTVEDLSETGMDNKYFCSDFCLNFCNDGSCDAMTCKTSCQTTMASYYSDSSSEEIEADAIEINVIDEDEENEVTQEIEETEENEETEESSEPLLGGDDHDNPDNRLPQEEVETQEPPPQSNNLQDMNGLPGMDDVPDQDNSNNNVATDQPQDNESTTGDGNGRNSNSNSNSNSGRWGHRGHHNNDESTTGDGHRGDHQGHHGKGNHGGNRFRNRQRFDWRKRFNHRF